MDPRRRVRQRGSSRTGAGTDDGAGAKWVPVGTIMLEAIGRVSKPQIETEPEAEGNRHERLQTGSNCPARTPEQKRGRMQAASQRRAPLLPRFSAWDWCVPSSAAARLHINPILPDLWAEEDIS